MQRKLKDMQTIFLKTLEGESINKLMKRTDGA